MSYVSSGQSSRFVGADSSVLRPPAEAPDRLKSRLAGVTFEPQVYVEIVSDRGSSVLVSGEVKAAGRFSLLEGPLTLIDAISKAGGPTKAPHLIDVIIRHGKSVKRMPLATVMSGANQQIRAGDEITLVSASKVFNALGAVKKNGQTEFATPNPTLMDALAQAEGLEMVPRRSVEYGPTSLPDMDLEAILRRRPELALVDELAHTNAEGMEHAKRYMDAVSYTHLTLPTIYSV